MCRKKVAGIALVVNGVILVALGVIIGFLLPNSILNTIEDSVCVNSKDNSGYKRWEGPHHYTTKAYIWNITNKEGFLYRGEKPKLVERGPYVYSITSKRINVKFKKGKVTSTTFEQAKFNKTLTERECPTCREDDKLAIINSVHLGLMAAAGSADEFKIASIPFVMDLLFKSLDKVTGNRNTSLILMGKAQFKPLDIPSFGSWVNPSKNFTLKEMRGLYGALLDPTKFGPFTDSSLRTRCLNGTLAKECGLSFNLYHLDIFYKTGDFFNLFRVAGFVKELLCPSPTFSCFVDNIFNPHLRDAGYYIIELSKHVLSYLESNNYGLVTSRKQSEITLGYQLPPVPGFPSGISVPGSVTSHSSETIAKEMGTNSTFYTCKSTEGDRFTFAAIAGKSKINKFIFPNAPPDQQKIRGYFIQFPGVKRLKPCSIEYTPVAKSYEVFIPQFYLAVPFTHKENVEVHGIPMHKYVLGKSSLRVNNVTVFTRGIFDVTRVFQAPIYASLPGFLHGDPSLYKDLNLTPPDTEKYGSFLSIEPISGTAFQLKLGFQLNGKILNSSWFPGTGDKNTSFVNKLIPISWSETEVNIDEQTAKDYTSQVHGRLRLSCGLLVSLPVIGGIFLITGIILIVLAVKATSSVAMATA